MNERSKIMVGTIGHIPVPNRGVGFKSHMSMALAASTIAQLNSRPVSTKPTKKQLDAWMAEVSSTDEDFNLRELADKIGEHAFNAGLAAAVAYLTGTAQDFEQTYARLINSRSRPTEHERKEAKACEDKAKLLRGQAGHIAGLKQT